MRCNVFIDTVAQFKLDWMCALNENANDEKHHCEEKGEEKRNQVLFRSIVRITYLRFDRISINSAKSMNRIKAKERCRCFFCPENKHKTKE